MVLTPGAATHPSTDEATSDWLARHPAVSVAIVGTLIVWVALHAFSASWTQWRSRSLPASTRLEGLRNSVMVLLFLWVFAVLLLPDDVGAIKNDMLAGAVLGGLVAFAALHLAALAKHRGERDRQEEALVAQGLPVRQHPISWKLTATLCVAFGCVLVPVSAIAIAMLVAVAAGGSVPQTIVEGITGAAALIWFIGSASLTARQWWRQREADKRYWMDYRAALRSRPQASGAPRFERSVNAAE